MEDNELHLDEIEYKDYDNDSMKQRQIEWLRKCLPVFVQPQHDVEHGYGLCGAFVDFADDTCVVNHIYEVLVDVACDD